ncbi:MAG: RecX family transcriptional regulator [Bacteroides sp.]|nr:RecX family transcriptional regulator [Bacteroides sp.]
MFKRRTPLTYENALSRAAGLCARCEQCTPEIMKKLESWGVSASDSAKVIARLEELAFVDDKRFAKAYAHDKLHFSGWGRRKIQQGLWLKCLPSSIIDVACEEFDTEDGAMAYRDVAVRVMKAKVRQLKEWPLSRESKIKLVKFAMARGFEYPMIIDIIRTDVARLREAEDDDEIE